MSCEEPEDEGLKTEPQKPRKNLSVPCFLCGKPFNNVDEIEYYYPDAGRVSRGYGQARQTHLICRAKKCFGNWTGSWS